jgi:hypothetical protein
MFESDSIRSSPPDLRVIFLQAFFEKSAEVSPKDRLVILPVTSSHLLNVLRILRELEVATHIFGTEPISVAVSVDDAAKVPLFNPAGASGKYKQVISLASKQ